MSGYAGYFCRKAILAIVRTPALTLLTSSTIAAVLLLLGAYLAVAGSLTDLVGHWSQNVRPALVLKATVALADATTLVAELRRRPEIAVVELWTPQAMVQDFKKRGPWARELTEGIDLSLLPTMIELELLRSLDLAARQELLRTLSESPLVEAVDSGHEALVQMESVLAALRGIGVVVALLLAAATTLVVSNTIRLVVHAQLDELRTLQLVGATGWFVRVPFVLQGALLGFLGSAIAVLSLWACAAFLQKPLGQYLDVWVDMTPAQLLSGPLLITLPAVGVALGATSALLASRRHVSA